MRVDRGRFAQGVLQLVLALFLLLPTAALAQSVGGQVTDDTGAVLPGVTVEAASPALIRGVRTTVTDGSGRYEVPALQPGVYKVTFKLSGFRLFVRDNVRVAADTTTAINAKLEVGQLEETVTVTGASPVVDVTQSTRHEVLDRKVLDELPTSRTTHSAGQIIPGLKMTGAMVGGQGNTAIQQYLVTRGKGISQNNAYVDGMNTGFGGGSQAYDNYGMAQEINVETNAISAEVEGGGVRINMIPREGGNKFNGDLSFNGLNGAWQADNLTPALRSGGPTSTGSRTPIRTPDGTEYTYDLNPSFGGPIMRDKLWFYASGRLNRGKLAPAGATYFETNPATGRLGPGTRQGFNETSIDNVSFRVTWQVNQKHKIATYRDQFWRYQSALSGNATQDWATVPTIYPRNTQYIFPTKWTMTATNRLLFEGGFQYYLQDQTVQQPQPGVEKTPGTSEWYANASRFDSATGLTTAGPASAKFRQHSPRYYYTGAMSFVTGSHSFKAGIQSYTTVNKIDQLNINAALQQRYVNGVPNAVAVYAIPGESWSQNYDTAVFAQERWTIHRLTLNLGMRVEHLTGAAHDASAPAGRFVPARSVKGFDLYNYTNVVPRLSVAYDLFSNGKTAVKASAGQFMQSTPTTGGGRTIFTGSEQRNWFDCDLVPGTSRCSTLRLATNSDGVAQDNEIPASTNPNFGYSDSLPSPNKLKREYSWDYSVSVQQELRTGMAVTAAWYHSHEGNLAVAVPAGITVNDYTRFQIPNPLNPSDAITVFNLKPSIPTGTTMSRMSDNYRNYNGVELSMVARLPSGGTIIGGWFADRKVLNLCDTDNPNNFRFCDTSGKTLQEYGKVPGQPWYHEFKASISHRLPWHFQGALTFNSAPGSGAGGGAFGDINQRWLQVAYTVPANLFPGGRTVPVSVNLLYPGQRRLERWNLLDMKVSRAFEAGHIHFNPQVEVYNLMNSNALTALTLSYSDALRLVESPTATLPGRMMKLGVLLKF